MVQSLVHALNQSYSSGAVSAANANSQAHHWCDCHSFDRGGVVTPHYTVTDENRGKEALMKTEARRHHAD
jgi:hypothetical protein